MMDANPLQASHVLERSDCSSFSQNIEVSKMKAGDTHASSPPRKKRTVKKPCSSVSKGWPAAKLW